MKVVNSGNVVTKDDVNKSQISYDAVHKFPTTFSRDGVPSCTNNERFNNKWYSIYYSNLDYFPNKKDEILNIKKDESPDVMCFTELLDKRKPVITKTN